MDELLHRRVQIRTAGYAMSRAELDPDVLGIAAPIRDDADNVVAAVSVAALTSRISPAAEAAVIDQVRTAGKDISTRLALVGG